MRKFCSRLAAVAVLAAAFAGLSSAADDDGTTLKVKEGQKLPDVELTATQADKALPGAKDRISLKDLQGKKNVVLFFYPKAMTSGCTKESCAFRDRMDEFKKLDTVIIGISTDEIGAQQKFTEKENLNFPLLADPDQRISKTLGVMRPNSKATQRVTFIVDKNGTIKKIYAPVADAAGHPEEVLKYVKENLGK
jgi:peroxiredoxin Q/BCP